MKREERYIVIKIKDLARCLSLEEVHRLDTIRKKINQYREENGKRILECAVVESDWPEYESTWEAISKRVE